jgi:hypothetical protein
MDRAQDKASLVPRVLTQVRAAVRRTGFDVIRYRDPIPPDFDAATRATIAAAAPYTMTSIERIAALRNAVLYLVRHAIPGDIVECGVWRGGSMMAAARTLLEAGDTSRDLWLYDTFEGMVAPRQQDRRRDGATATELQQRGESFLNVAPLEGVRAVMDTVGYPRERIHYVKGKVEDTIPAEIPDVIALLRLDTDWYESTRHELTHLFPRVSAGGVLIVDDYGYWQGQRQAIDEYLADRSVPILLNRIDDAARIAVVPPQIGAELL